VKAPASVVSLNHRCPIISVMLLLLWARMIFNSAELPFYGIIFAHYEAPKGGRDSGTPHSVARRQPYCSPSIIGLR
jgi:hypothetical protein